MRFTPPLFAAALIVGCATLPEIHPWTTPEDTAAPKIVGARGTLGARQTQNILARLQAKGGGSDLLERHIAIEEAISGQPLTVGNQVTLLRDGPATYQSMFEAIERARDHVNVEFYIIDHDEMGRSFGELLLRKAAEGVSVNLIYDSVGSGEIPREYFDALRAGGVKVLEFNPVNPLKARRGWRINSRTHRKVVIVDGSVALTGGINISDVYSSGSSPGSGTQRSGRSRTSASPGSASVSGSQPGSRAVAARTVGWRDTNVRIEGPAVEQLQRIFLQTWSAQGGEPLAQRAWFPPLKRQGSHPVRILASGPGDEVPAIYLSLLTAIEHAESSVHITVAYFVPDPQTLKVLMDAATRGVDVVLVLPSYTDFWAVFHAGRSHYAALLEAGVKIYERQHALLHAKTVVIDGVWSSIGSSNMDWRSFLHNAELNAVVLGWNFGRDMESMYQDDVRSSVRIEREAWARRPLKLRMREWLARMWEYWL